MTKYLLKRLLHGLISVIIIVGIVMLLVYSLMDRKLIFSADLLHNRKDANERIVYEYEQWENYGYLDYVTYAEYLSDLLKKGEIDEDTRAAASLKSSADKDTSETKAYIEKFTQEYEAKGYTVEHLSYDSRTKQRQQLFAYKDIPVLKRLWNYFTELVQVDNIHYVEDKTGEKLENTGITFTFYDPVYNDYKGLNKKVFSPAIIGTGTQHKFLLYFDNQFPYIHQNLVTINLGMSYSVNRGIDVFTTLTEGQDPNLQSTITYPSGLTEKTSTNLHSATYVKGSQASDLNSTRFTDDYTNVSYFKTNHSRTGFSFIIGLISVFFSYLLGVPLGILMARKKNTFIDHLGSVYVIFIIAVPSLAYIFLFQQLGGAAGLPMSFSLDEPSKLMYILPIISLALPSVAGIMKWLRRYMIDQQNSDYVKFARSGGLSESEIFRKHILKNAIIPIVHGIPGSILGSLVGAIITERIYQVPGAGYMLTKAIGQYDNGVIVGLTLFYALLSILSLILGDILMSIVDPRISFSEKAR